MLIEKDSWDNDIRYFYDKCLQYKFYDVVLLKSVQYNHIYNIDKLKELDYDFTNDVTKKAILNSITAHRIDFVHKMIKYGAGVNDEMLDEVCARGYVSMVRLLLDNGCDKGNKNAIMYARNNGYDEIVAMFE